MTECYLPIDRPGARPFTGMGHGRKLRRGFIEDDTPELAEGQIIGRVADIRGKGIIAIQMPCDDEESGLRSSLAHLPPRFRGVLYLRRGIYVMQEEGYISFVRGVCGFISLGGG